MASISSDRNGNRRIFFSRPNRKRKIIYLGEVPMKTVRTYKVHVEEPGGRGASRARPGPRNLGVGGQSR